MIRNVVFLCRPRCGVGCIMFIVLALFCLASSYGQRPATDLYSSVSSSETLSDLLESTPVLDSYQGNATMTLQEHNLSLADDDWTNSSSDQYFHTQSTNQYSYSSPVAIQSFQDSSTNSYQPSQSSILQDRIYSTSLQSSLTLQPSILSYHQEEGNDAEVLDSVSSLETSSIKPSAEVLAPSVSSVMGKSSKEKGHSIDDILGSIKHRLGSSVKLVRPETERVSHEKAATPVRKNDRGPPKVYPSETAFLQPTSFVSEAHQGSSSVSVVRDDYPTIASEPLPTSVDSVLINPSFSLDENEASEANSGETSSSSLDLSLLSTFNASESIINEESIKSTGNISYSTLQTPLRDHATDTQESLQELEPRVNHTTGTVVEPGETEQAHIPTGPITDWVPLLERPSIRRSPQVSANNESELIILTEPSIFNITVSNSIGHSAATTDPRIFPSESSTESNFSSTGSPPTRSTPSNIDPQPTRTKENLHPTLSNGSAVNVESTRPSLGTVASQTPDPPDYDVPKEEAAEIDEVIVTLLGSGTLKSPPATTAPANPGSATGRPSNPGSATGRPYVIPVDIEEVRPFIGAQIPTGPSSQGRPQVSRGHVQVAQAGINVADENGSKKGQPVPSGRPALIRPPRPRPTPPLIRIDTCIVGDDSTCDDKLNEYCKTDQGISSCQCQPGYSRTFPRGPCQAVIKMVLSIRLDKLGDQNLVFNRRYLDSGSQEYQQLEYETRQAINSLFLYTPYARTFMGSTINKFYPLGRKVVANSTILLDESTQSSNLRQSIRHEMVKAISNNNNNLGDSKLYVDESQNPIPAIEDLNECSDPNLNDCSPSGYCINSFATFRCTCNPGFMDKHPNEERKSGRICTACSPEYCNNHGVCVISNGQRECKCRGNYIGSKCEIDGEVLGVALGASLAAMVIIVLTLVCLCVWNRRWKREQYKADMTSVPTMGGYPSKTISPINTYRLSIEDRVRWAHIADAMGSNYATAERPGRSLPTKQEGEESYYGHPGRPRSRLCHNGPHSNGYYTAEFPPRELYHSSPNRFVNAGTVRPYYS